MKPMNLRDVRVATAIQAMRFFGPAAAGLLALGYGLQASPIVVIITSWVLLGLGGISLAVFVIQLIVIMTE
jgi:hypothetical protein